MLLLPFIMIGELLLGFSNDRPRRMQWLYERSAKVDPVCIICCFYAYLEWRPMMRTTLDLPEDLIDEIYSLDCHFKLMKDILRLQLDFS